MHPSKNRVNYHHNVSQTFMLTGNHLSLSLGGTVLKIVPLTQVNFFFIYLIVYDCTGNVEGSCISRYERGILTHFEDTKRQFLHILKSTLISRQL